MGSVSELEGQLITPEVTSSPHNLTSVPQPQNDNNTSASNSGSSTIATSPAPVPHNKGNSATPSSSQSSKKQKSGVDELIVASLNNIQERREKQVKKEIDEESHFCQQVAATLRRFTTRQKAFAKLQIEQVLVNVEFPLMILIHLCID